MNTSFDIGDLNEDVLHTRAMIEAIEIHSKTSTRNNRTLDEVYQSALRGHAAELFLIEQCGYENDPRPYKDVINASGESVEVKVTDCEYYVSYVLERANEAARQKWRKYPKKLIIFINKKGDTCYNMHQIYTWNGQEFI